jgi:phosphatidate cytidylyltransferase
MIVWGGKPAVFLLAAVVNIIGLKEFYSLTLTCNRKPVSFLTMVASLCLLAWCYEYGDYFCAREATPYIILFLTSIMFVVSMLYLFSVVKFPYQSSPVLIGFFGLLYVTIPSFLAVIIYSLKQGAEFLLFTFIVIWAGDTGAYGVGRRLGRHRLYAAVSPKKTVEGAVAGLTANILTSVILQQCNFVAGLELKDALSIGAGVGVVSQLGDLSESLMKRKSGVKDSGTLFPGHGGLLDRIDSLLFSIPFIYFYLQFITPWFITR